MSTTRTREALEDFAFHYALEYAMELFDGHPSWERSYHQIRSIGDLFSALPNGDSQDVKKVAKIKRFYKAMQVVGSKAKMKSQNMMARKIVVGIVFGKQSNIMNLTSPNMISRGMWSY